MLGNFPENFRKFSGEIFFRKIYTTRPFPGRHLPSLPFITMHTILIYQLITDWINPADNAVSSDHPYVHLFPLYIRNSLTADLELSHVSRS